MSATLNETRSTTRVQRRSKRPKVLTIVGARPQFVKLAPLSRALRVHVREVVVHTGQHYDREMSASFFRELRLPKPHAHLGIGSGSHGHMTGRMLEALEATMCREEPQAVIVLGDTNSTLAGALAAVKLGIPVAHVEAGLRSFDLAMPEEVNRRVTDHVSQLLFCPTATAVDNLRREGITRGVHKVGDVMMDAVIQNVAILPRSRHTPAFYLATLHRPHNVDDAGRLARIIEALESLPRPVLLPLHPRTRLRMEQAGLQPDRTVRILPPQGHLAMLRLLRDAEAVLTDSGGVQKEAFLLGTPCVTLRETTEWVETLEHGANRLTGADPRRIRRAIQEIEQRRPRWRPSRVFGDGKASERIARTMARFLAG